MDFTSILQPQPFADVLDPPLFVPTEEEVVPNPFAIPQGFGEEPEAPEAEAAAPDKKASGVFDDIQSQVESTLGKVKETVQGAVGQVGTTAATAGQTAGHGLLDTLMGGVKGFVHEASQAVQAEFQPLADEAQKAANPAVAQLAHTAGKSATAGAQEQVKAGGTGLGIDTTTLVLGGAAVLGALGLGAWLLTKDDSPKYAPQYAPSVRPFETGMVLAGASKTDDSGLGTAAAVIGGTAAVALLAGYLAKNGSPFGASKSSSGVALATGPVTGTHVGAALSIGISSPAHPYNLADLLGLSRAMLPLDPGTILGPNPKQHDHDDFFAAYAIGHKAGANNCDAARLQKTETVYLKDTTKSQVWDNGWVKGYFDGWVAEGCRAGIKKTSSGPGPAGPAGEHVVLVNRAGQQSHGLLNPDKSIRMLGPVKKTHPGLQAGYGYHVHEGRIVGPIGRYAERQGDTARLVGSSARRASGPDGPPRAPPPPSDVQVPENAMVPPTPPPPMPVAGSPMPVAGSPIAGPGLGLSLGD